MLNVPFNIMPVAPWFMFGRSISEVTLVGILFLNCMYNLRDSLTTPCVPAWKKLTAWTTLLMRLGPVVVSLVGLGHLLNSLGAITPMCPLAARVSNIAVISSLKGEPKPNVYPGLGTLMYNRLHLRRTCVTCVPPDL